MPTIHETYNEQVRQTIRNNAEFNFDFVFMNTLATVIACYGLFADSPAVVIGAMIVAMLLGPILGIALALVDSDVVLLKSSLGALALGVLGILFTAFFIGLLHNNIPLTREIMARTAPNLLDLMVALAGGAAGAYATVSPRLSAAFVGVAIATALVPPLSTTGLLLARGEFHLASGAFLLTFTNIVAIQLSASLVMWFTGFRKMLAVSGQDENMQFAKNNLASVMVLGVLAVILAANLQQAVANQMNENEARQIISNELAQLSDYNNLADVVFDQKPDKLIIRPIVRGLKPLTAEQVTNLEKKLAFTFRGIDKEVNVRFVQTMDINRDGIVKIADETSVE